MFFCLLLIPWQCCLGGGSFTPETLPWENVEAVTNILPRQGSLLVEQHECGPHGEKAPRLAVVNEGPGQSSRHDLSQSNNVVQEQYTNPFSQKSPLELLRSANWWTPSNFPVSESQTYSGPRKDSPSLKFFESSFLPTEVGLLTDEESPSLFSSHHLLTQTPSKFYSSSQLFREMDDVSNQGGHTYLRNLRSKSYGEGQDPLHGKTDAVMASDQDNGLSTKRKAIMKGIPWESSSSDLDAMESSSTDNYKFSGRYGENSEFMPNRSVSEVNLEGEALALHLKLVTDRFLEVMNLEAVEGMQGLECFLTTLQKNDDSDGRYLRFLFRRSPSDLAIPEENFGSLESQKVNVGTFQRPLSPWKDGKKHCRLCVLLAVQGQLGREICVEMGLAEQIEELAVNMGQAAERLSRTSKGCQRRILAPQKLVREALIIALYKTSLFFRISKYLQVPMVSDTCKGLQDALSIFATTWFRGSHEKNIRTFNEPSGSKPMSKATAASLKKTPFDGMGNVALLKVVLSKQAWYQRLASLVGELMSAWIHHYSEELPLFWVIQSPRRTSLEFNEFLNRCAVAQWFGRFPQVVEFLR